MFIEYILLNCFSNRFHIPVFSPNLQRGMIVEFLLLFLTMGVAVSDNSTIELYNVTLNSWPPASLAQVNRVALVKVTVSTNVLLASSSMSTKPLNISIQACSFFATWLCHIERSYARRKHH